MTSLALEPAYAGGTPDLIRGPVVETKPRKPTRSSRAKSRGADELEDEPDLIADEVGIETRFEGLT
jgi:hypothetical protein